MAQSSRAAQLAVNLICNAKGFDGTTRASRNEIVKLKKELNSSMKDFGKFTGSVKSLIGSFSSFLGPLVGITSAVGAFKESLSVNAVMEDNFNRAVEGAKGAVDSFFTSLTTGSFDGFLEGLGKVIEASRQLYDNLDNLATFRIYEGADMAELQAEFSKYQSIVRNAKAKDENGKLIYSEEEVRAAQEGMTRVQNQMHDVLQKEKAMISQVQDSIVQSIMEQTGSTRALTVQMLTEFDTAEKVGARMKQLKDQYYEVREILVADPMGGTSMQKALVWTSSTAEKEYNMLKKLSAAASDGEKNLGAYNQKRKELANVNQQIVSLNDQIIRTNNKANNFYLGGSGSGSSVQKYKKYGVEEIEELNKRIEELRHQEEIELGFDTDPKEVARIEDELDYLTRQRSVIVNIIYREQHQKENSEERVGDVNVGLNKEVLGMDALQDTIKDIKLPDLSVGLDIVFPQDDIERWAKNWTADFNTAEVQKYADAIGSIGNAVEGVGGIMDESSGKMVSWVGNLISSMAQLFSKIIPVVIANQGMLPFPENLAAIASTVAMITGAIASFPHYAKGGIIGGNDHTDSTPVYVSSGEMILNQQQQRNLMQVMDNSTGKNITTQTALWNIINAPHFASGGIVGGNNYTDSLPIFVSSGEMILNQAEQSKLWNVINNTETFHTGIDSGKVEFVIRGKDLASILDTHNSKYGR